MIIWLFLQILLLTVGNHTRGEPPYQLLQGASVLFCLSWLLRGRNPESLRYLFSAYLGWLLAFALSGPLAVAQRVWPTVWLRLSDAKIEPSLRAPLVTLQLLLAGFCPWFSPAWVFCRVCAAVGGLVQLRGGRGSAAAGRAILLSGIGPALAEFWSGSPDSRWLTELLATAVLLSPQIWLSQREALEISPAAEKREWPYHLLLLILGFGLGIWSWVNSLPRGCGGSLTACKSNCKNIATALEMYASDNQGQYPRRLEPYLIRGNYLKSIPTCPNAGKVTYTDYRTSKGRTHFHFSCVGNNHGKAYTGFQGPADNFPAYDAEEGLLDHP